MEANDREHFPPTPKILRDGRQVTLRFLSGEDGERLADFYASVPREDFRFYRPHALDREHALKKAARADEATSVILVAETDDGRIAGYAWYQWKPEADKSIFGICLRHEFQGAGLAPALTGRLLEIARTVGPTLMTLNVHIANGRAVAFYKSIGFTTVRTDVSEGTFGFPPEPQYWMERSTR